MEKTGWWRLPKSRCRKTQVKCINCGAQGVNKVSFEDKWSKLIVPLCENCTGKRYEELKLQTSIDWPGMA